MSPGRGASFVVRAVREQDGRITGVIEQVATGAKEAFASAEAIGRLIAQMLKGGAGERT